MKSGFFLIIFSLLICLGQNIYAVPAYPHPVEYTLPDGSTLTIILKGDEKIRWATTEDGYTILRNDAGFFEYAIKTTKGDLQLSGIYANNVKNRSLKEDNLLKTISKELTYSDSQKQVMRDLWKINDDNKDARKAYPTTGDSKLLCILIGFSDLAFTKTKEDFEFLFNQQGYDLNGATGSMKDYYLENSWGQLNLTTTVAGPYTAENNMAYYGSNSGASGNDSNPRALVREAVYAADADIDFSEFADGNTVPGIYIIYAGYGEESGASPNAIWAHEWTLGGAITVDGVRVNTYSCSSELRGNRGNIISTIGVVCHEFGHVLGAPDYYDTDSGTGGSFEGTGNWDIMAGGSWNNNGITPSHHNAYTKTYTYGWASVTTLSEPDVITLPKPIYNTEFQGSVDSYYRINTDTPNEFFLLENRQREGFDRNLPGHGMIIYHIHKDFATSLSSNTINTTHPQKFYPVCANARNNPNSNPTSYGGGTSGNLNAAGTPFPGSSGKTSFTGETMPSMILWNGNPVNKPITSIIENAEDQTITFDFMGGRTPTDFEAMSLSDTKIDLKWNLFKGNDVLIASSLSSIITQPIDGNEYSVGQQLGNSDETIIYKGNYESFIHTELTASTLYYYKIWTVTGDIPEYSDGAEASARTKCSAIGILPFFEDFETGFIDDCWEQVFINNSIDWTLGEGNGNGKPKNSYSGNKNLIFKITAGANRGSINRLSLPIIDLAVYGDDEIILEFWMVSQVFGSDQDVLKVCYRTYETEWTVLETYNSNITEWTKQTITLPANVDGLQIAFEAEARWGNGICIDDILIYNAEAPLINNIELNPENPVTSDDIIITANILNTNGTIENCSLLWSLDSPDLSNTIDMIIDEDNVYYASIPATEQSGTLFYQIIATNSIGRTSQSNEYSVIVSEKSSIKLEKSDNTVIIYPNPASGMVFIDSGNICINKIELFNMAGQFVSGKNISEENAPYTFSLANINQGLYMLRITTDKGVISKVLSVR